MKFFLLLPLLVALPLLGVEEAGLADSYRKMERRFNDYRIRTNTPEAAIEPLHYFGEVLPSTVERLKGCGRREQGAGTARRLCTHGWTS